MCRGKETCSVGAKQDRMRRSRRKGGGVFACPLHQRAILFPTQAISQPPRDLVGSLSVKHGKQRQHLPSQFLTTSGSGDEEWFDPFAGLRSHRAFHENWFLAAKGEIGGFCVGAEITWFSQATVGHRHLLTDDSDGGFTNDITQTGLYSALNLRF